MARPIRITAVSISSENLRAWTVERAEEFVPVLNDEHLGYAWIDSGTWPRPMHPGLWSTVNMEAVQDKILRVEQDLAR